MGAKWWVHLKDRVSPLTATLSQLLLEHLGNAGPGSDTSIGTRQPA